MNVLEFMRDNWREVLALAGEHLLLVAVSTAFAVAIGLPAGVLLTRRASLKRPVLGLANVLQTVPSLALFGLLIPLPLLGVGARTAVVALVVYALLPVIRNTVAGIEGVDASVRESAVAMGMRGGQILRLVELPLAAPVILAGVRVAAVTSVGVATVAAFVGAGGLGALIYRGLRQYDNKLIFAGALPAALLALAADYLIGLVERRYGAGRRATAAGRGRILTTGRVVFAGVALAAGLGVAYNSWRGASARPDLVVGSKDFTESIILAEMLAQSLEARGLRVGRSYELGGNLCHDSLVAGRIDAYPEYTGTSFTAILKHPPVSDPREVYEQVRREYAEKFGVEVGDPLGFSNDFAILVRGDDARRLNLRTISDAAPHAPGFRAGFGQDFMSREDGYAGLVRAYDLRFGERPREMDLSLSYRALADRQVDVIAGNSTDGMIAALGLTQLEDDRRYFPPYEAVMLTRRDALARHPATRDALGQLAGSISTEEMRHLNYEVDGRKRAPADVVREWRRAKGLQ
jgi:osmoprotectant transport system permease protein